MLDIAAVQWVLQVWMRPWAIGFCIAGRILLLLCYLYVNARLHALAVLARLIVDVARVS